MNEIYGEAGTVIVSMTTTQRDAITPVDGTLIYNSTTNEFEKYEESVWKKMVTKERFYSFTSGTQLNKHRGGFATVRFDNGTGDVASCSGRIPNDLTLAKEFAVVHIPIGAKITLDAVMYLASLGEAFDGDQHSSIGRSIPLLVAGRLSEFDCVTPIPATMTADDYFGLLLTESGDGTDTDTDLVGLRLEYV